MTRPVAHEGFTAGRIIDGWHSTYGAPDAATGEWLISVRCAGWLAAVPGRAARVRPGLPDEQPFVVEIRDVN